MGHVLYSPRHCALHRFGSLQRRLKNNGVCVENFDIDVVNGNLIEMVQT